jgi:tetratricopeptide (TPR) repeat protein
MFRMNGMSRAHGCAGVTMSMFRSISLVLALLFCCIKISWANERLELLKDISSSGAPSLTLKMLDQTQPKVDVDLYEWILWEQERYAILSKWQQWDELIVRIERLPDDLPIQFKNQATTQRIEAYLELNQTATARKILRQQLWQSASDSNVEEQTWRRQIIISYIKDNRLADAQVAMLRFDQDFEEETPDWLILRATVLIQAERYKRAMQLLKGLDSWQAKATYLLAQLRAKQITANDLRRLITPKMEHPDTSDDELTTLAALRFIAAEQLSLVDRVVALEGLFQIGHHSPLVLFKVAPDTLWDAYIEYAYLVGNRAELLIGDDEKWLELAHNVIKVTPIKARSLFASLIVNSTDATLVRQAAEGYLISFREAADTKQNLLDQLFNRSKTFANAEKIPPNIRYQLVDLALKKADIDEATRLMSGLTSYPKGSSRFGWQLRQARVLILGGRYDEGSQIMQGLIAEYKQVSTQNTDRILQVLFDMQTVELHTQTIALLNQLLSASIDPRQHREILFWIADSYKGMMKFDQAALLYLQSAMVPGPATMDLWAQTARYNAAECLRQSGLTDDARRIFESLLKITQDPARRALLNRSIQQLLLKPIVK